MKRLLILSLLGIGFLGQALGQDWSDYIVPGVAVVAGGLGAGGLGVYLGAYQDCRNQLAEARAQLAEAYTKNKKLDKAHKVLKQRVEDLYKKVQNIGIVLTTREGARILSEGMMSREDLNLPRVRLLDVWNDNKEVLNKIVIDATQVNRMPLPLLETVS